MRALEAQAAKRVPIRTANVNTSYTTTGVIQRPKAQRAAGTAAPAQSVVPRWG